MRAAAGPAVRPALPGVVVYLLARVPSLLEPHWFTDEAGYSTAARAILDGRFPYSSAWSNKPPLHLLTLAVPVAVTDASEAGLHALTLLSGLAALAAVAYAGHHLLSPRRTMVAVALAALALGLPVFDAQLAVPESLLIAPASWAGALLAVEVLGTQARPGGLRVRRIVAVGLLAAAGIAYQQTAVADAAAFLLVLLLSPRARGRDAAVYAATLVGATAAWVVPVVAVAGPHTVGFALVGFYVAYTQSVLPVDTAGQARHAAALGAALLLLVAGAAMGRRSRSPAWVFAVWAGAALLVPAAAHQPYAHFLSPGVVPVALTAASLRLPAARGRAVGAALLTGTGLVTAGVMARTAGVDWIPPANTIDASGAHHLGAYYGGLVNVAVGRDDLEAWRERFDDRVASDRDTAAWLRAHGLAGAPAVVWSSDAWLYLLADLRLLLPTAPIYNDQVLIGQGGPVADRVRGLDPVVVVVADDAQQQFPEITPLLDERYREVVRFGVDAVYLRGGATAAGPPTDTSSPPLTALRQ